MPRRAKGGTGHRGRPRKSQNLATLPTFSVTRNNNFKSREGGSYKDFLPDLDISAPLNTIRLRCQSQIAVEMKTGRPTEHALPPDGMEGNNGANSSESTNCLATSGVSNEVTGVDLSVLPKPSFQRIMDSEETWQRGFRKPVNHYMRYREPSESELLDIVEYDMDEQDDEWLQMLNNERNQNNFGKVSCDLFESIIDRLEKEWFILIRDLPPILEEHPTLPEDSPCAICNDNEGENSNAIVFCDGCNIAVHQDCYGIPYIPEGQWLCRKCMISPEKPVSCLFCPNEGGAYKQTNTNAWAHLLCAMWIPEAGVSNNIYMEPVDNIEHIPKSRWKLTCCICRKRQGACIQCDNKHCFAAFHATCARSVDFSMRMKTHTKEGVILKAYCDRHRPRESDNEDDTLLQGRSNFVQRTLKPRRNGRRGQAIEVYIPSPENSSMAIDEISDESDRGVFSIRREKKRKRVESRISHRGRTRTKVHTTMLPISYPVARGAYQQQYFPTGAPIVPDTIFAKIENLPCVLEAQIKEKSKAITSICHYWSLKRQSRRGASLLKRLHLEPWRISAMHRRRSQLERSQQYTVANLLRSDLEVARMLTGQVQKREKLKLERIRKQKAYLEMVLFPAEMLIKPILEKLADLENDCRLQRSSSVLYDVRKRLTGHAYFDLQDFESDLKNIWKEMTPSDVILKLQAAAETLLEKAKEDYNDLEIDDSSGKKLAVEIDHELFAYKRAAHIPLAEEIVDCIKTTERSHDALTKRGKQYATKKAMFASLQQDTEALQIGSSKPAPYARRRTRSHGSEALAATAEELEKKSARMSAEARKLFTSFIGLKLDQRTVMQYKKDEKRDAPHGWIYVENDDSDEEADEDEQSVGVPEQPSLLTSSKNADTKKNIIAHRPPVSFKDGEVVWARVSGFPAHPAKIVDVKTDGFPKRILSGRSSKNEVLVQFYKVPEHHKWGWVEKKDIWAFGYPDLDREMLLQAKKSKRSTRIKEAQRGYRFVCKLQNVNPEPQIQAVFCVKN